MFLTGAGFGWLLFLEYIMAIIVKEDIIEDVNENLRLLLATDSTELDRAIIKTLKDMSKNKLLVGTDGTQTLTNTSTTLAYPTGFREAINITLIDGSGNAKRPLRKLTGGHREYRELRENDSNTGFTEWYSEFNKLFYLWRPPNQSFTTLIEYYKNHANDPDNIEFDEKFEDVMFAGTTFWKAMALTRTKAIGIWGPVYSGLLRTSRPNLQPVVVGG